MKRKNQVSYGKDYRPMPLSKKIARTAQQCHHQKQDAKQDEQPVKQSQHEDCLDLKSWIVVPSPSELEYLHDELDRLRFPVLSVEQAKANLGSNPWRLGAGGYGEAFLNVKTRIVAKFSFTFDSHISSLKEAKWMIELEDVPGIQRLVGICPERFMLLSEYGGPTLQKVLRTEGALTPKQWIQVAIKLAEAFQGMHSCDIIHNDIKSDNICVAIVGNSFKVTPIDFGLARRAGEVIKRRGKFSITRHYAPEFYQESQGARCSSLSDIYAIGRVIYQIMQVLNFKIKTPLISKWVNKSQSLCPTDRYNMSELLVALKQELRLMKLCM